MTTTYDPFDPRYYEPDDLRDELDRVYDLCHGCRLCFKFCTAFPTLFDFIDRHDDQDSTRLSDDERFAVVDECFNCKLCYVNCPYTPGQHEWELDFPRLMLRAKQIRNQSGRRTLRERLTDQAVGRTDLSGRLGAATAPVANKVIAKPGSTGRKLLEKVTGVSSERILDPYARQRFSTWFAKRPDFHPERKQADAIVFPTCMVEYQNTGIGKDLVKVCERNEIACSLPPGQLCCGAPFLHQGDVEEFRRKAQHNVEVLAGAIRKAQARGEDPRIVVPQPTCSLVLKTDYDDYLRTPDAKLVSERTMDASEFLMSVHKGEGTGLDTDFAAEVPDKVTYHAPCHLRAQNMGLRSRDLIKLTGTKPTVVAECSAIDGMWGLKAQNVEISRKVAQRMVKAIDKAGNDAIVGDCTLANGGIQLETGNRPIHPVQFLARAYGIPEEDR